MAKPEKFTSQDPSKLHLFIVGCIMAFDSWPCKFVTDCQQVSYAALYLSKIAMLWWQPSCSHSRTVHLQQLGEFVDQPNTYFGQPNLAQASKLTLCALKCRITSMSISTWSSFPNMQPIQDGTMQLSMVSSIRDLLSASKTILLRIQVSVQILIPLIFYSSQFILLIFHSCMHLQSASVSCDCFDCIVSQECDSVTSALFQRLRYGFISSSLFLTVSYFSFRQSVR